MTAPIPVKIQTLVRYDESNTESSVVIDIQSEIDSLSIKDTKEIRSNDFDIQMSIPIVDEKDADSISLEILKSTWIIRKIKNSRQKCFTKTGSLP